MSLCVQCKICTEPCKSPDLLYLQWIRNYYSILRHEEALHNILLKYHTYHADLLN